MDINQLKESLLKARLSLPDWKLMPEILRKLQALEVESLCIYEGKRVNNIGWAHYYLLRDYVEGDMFEGQSIRIPGLEREKGE